MNKVLLILRNKNILWNMIGITVNSFFSLFLVILITRINGIEASGTFSFVFYLSATFQQIGNFGGRIYQISDVSNKYISGSYIVLKYCSSLIMIIISLIFCFANGYDSSKFILFMIFMVYHIFECIAEAYYGILQKHNRLDIIGKSMTYRVLISFVLFVAVNLLTRDLILSSSTFILGYSVILYFYDIPKCRKYEKVHLRLDNKIIRLMKESYKVCLFTFFNLLMLNITRYIVDINLSDELQGYFSILIMPAALIALFAQFLVQPLVTPLVKKYQENHYDSFAKSTTVVLIIVLLFGIVAAIGAYFVLPYLLEIVYGLSFSEFKYEIVIVIFSGICSSLTTVVSTILIIMRKMNAQLMCFILSVIFNCIISYLFVKENVSQAIFCYFVGLAVQLVVFLGVYFYYIRRNSNVVKT